jgi:RimJ/RimL family protein N-acetyltransferase
MTGADHFDPQPTLVGETIALRPLRSDDLDALHAAAADPLIWELHSDPWRHRRDVFEAFFAASLASGGALIVTERGSGEVIGSSRYYDWDPARREVAIGFTFLTRRHWGGSTNRELKRLMLDHAFRFAERVWFHVAKSNWRSRRAMEKVGAMLSHETMREHGGVLLDYLVYKVEARQASG